MKDTVKRAWLALHRARIADSTLRRLICATQGDPENILALPSDQLIACGVSNEVMQVLTNSIGSKNRQLTQQLEQDWRLLNTLQIEILPFSSHSYPELLKQIIDPPPILYTRGRLSLLNRPQLAVVGSRKPSRQGCEHAFCFSKELASAGFTITSGLALGIDAKSHQGALAATGDTVAVLGTGVDMVYPVGNRSLSKEIIERGIVVSEFRLGSAPERFHFPQRNRVITGLSLGVLVVEAALKSGSLISARSALEQNREVFAIPGSIYNPASKGCHSLIREGAKLVEAANDILEELTGWYDPSVDKNLAKQAELNLTKPTQNEQKLLNIIGYDPASITTLLQCSGWSVALLTSTLISLEIKGLVENKGSVFQRVF